MLRLAIQRLGLVVSSQLGQNDAERCQGPGQLGQEDVEVSLSQTADDGQPGLIVLGGAGRVPRRHRDVAQPLAADAQVPLPLGVGRVGGGQPLGEGQPGPGPVVLGGAGQVPRRHREVAQPLAANAQVPLPPGRLNHHKRKEYIQPRQGCNLFRFFKASALPTLTASQYHHSACRRSQSSKSCPNYS